MNATRIDMYAGMRRELEIGVQLAPTRAGAIPAAKAVGALLDDDEHVAVRLAGLAADESRVLITIAVTLGTIEEIKSADATSRSAMALIQRIVDDLAGYDPAFVTLPDPQGAEARLASMIVNRQELGEGRVITAISAFCSAA